MKAILDLQQGVCALIVEIILITALTHVPIVEIGFNGNAAFQ